MEQTEQRRKKRALIFGTGRYYEKRKERLWELVEVAGFIDNALSLHGTRVDGRRVYFPEEAGELEWDCVVLMSARTGEMHRQLVRLGILETRILVYEELIRGELQVFGEPSAKAPGKRVLLLTVSLDYNGGTMAAMYAARGLIAAGYEVAVAAEGYEEAFLEETLKDGFQVFICPSLPHPGPEELAWMKTFDLFLVNTLQMAETACLLTGLGPVLWWIHESQLFYRLVMERWENQKAIRQIGRIPLRVCAVSRIPEKYFNAYFPGAVKSLLPYGIPDERRDGERRGSTGQIVFAVIGCVDERKAQEAFVRAALRLKEAGGAAARFLIIGLMSGDAYEARVRRLCEGCPEIEICGVYTREQLAEVYPELDVVVCPSIEDPLPIVMTEAMMQGKALIVSEATGTREYIEDQVNGLICGAGDEDSLYEKMKWALEHAERLPAMGRLARKTYEEHFTMEAFSRRLAGELEEARTEWERGRRHD